MVDFVNVLRDFLSDDERTDVLVLSKEYYHLIAAHLNSDVSADRVLHYRSYEGSHHEVEVKR